MSQETHLSETDHLKLRLASETASRLQAEATLAASVARGAAFALEQEQARIRKEYGIQGEDRCDIGTGEIARATSTPAKPAPEAAKPSKAKPAKS